MPKAAVNEQDFASAWKDQIGVAGEVADVQSVTIAGTVEYATNEVFRFCVFAPDGLGRGRTDWVEAECGRIFFWKRTGFPQNPISPSSIPDATARAKAFRSTNEP